MPLAGAQSCQLNACLPNLLTAGCWLGEARRGTLLVCTTSSALATLSHTRARHPSTPPCSVAPSNVITGHQQPNSTNITPVPLTTTTSIQASSSQSHNHPSSIVIATASQYGCKYSSPCNVLSSRCTSQDQLCENVGGVDVRPG